MSQYLSEAFEKLNTINEEAFDLSKTGLEDLKDFQDKDDELEMNDDIEIIDTEAYSDDELQDTYDGKVILDCNVCHSKIYKDPEDIVVDEDCVNPDDECPTCQSKEGYTIVGQIEKFDDEELGDDQKDYDEEDLDDIEDEEPFEDEGEEETDESEDEDEDKDENKDKDEDKSKSKKDKKKDESLLRKKVFGKKNKKESLSKTYRKSIKESSNNKLNVNSVANFLEEATEFMKENQEYTIYKYNIDPNFVFCVYWSGGFDKDDYDCVIQANENPEYGLVVALKIRNDDEWDGEFLNLPYNKETGEVYVEDYTISPTENYIYMAKDLIHDYEFVQSLIAEGKDVGLDESFKKNKKNHRKLNENNIRANVQTDTDEFTFESDGETFSITNKKDDIEPKDEVIAPLDDETEAEIMDNEENTEDEESEFEDVEDEMEDVDEIDEESMDELGEGYLKKVYSNVDNFRTTSAKYNERTKKLQLEGLIKFNSGKTKKTKFILEACDRNRGRMTLKGCNEQITRGKKAFSIRGKVQHNKFLPESLQYRYSTRDNNGKKLNLFGTVHKNR